MIVFDEVIERDDEGSMVDVVYMDFQKAVNTVTTQQVFLIRENITAVLRGDISEGSPTESIWVELKYKNVEITLIILYYRPPNSQWKIEEQICKEITDSCKKGW